MSDYTIIRDALIHEIEEGAVAPGDPIPSEHELVKRFGVKRHQARQALHELAALGYIVRMQGKGSFVAPSGSRPQLPQSLDSKTVAVIFPEYKSRYHRNIVEGFLGHIDEAGYHAVAHFSRLDREAEGSMIRRIPQSGMVGAAIYPYWVGKESCSAIETLTKQQFPLVMVDRFIEDIDCDFVVTDNKDLGYRLTKVLIERGHTRIAFMSNMDKACSVKHRVLGYREAMHDAGLAENENVCIPLDDSLQLQESLVWRLMSLRDAPTALVCVHDLLAVGVEEQLVKLGYRVPFDIDIATVDDGHHGDKMEHFLFSAAQNGMEIGRNAAKVLINRIMNPTAPLVRNYLPAGPIRIPSALEQPTDSQQKEVNALAKRSTD